MPSLNEASNAYKDQATELLMYLFPFVSVEAIRVCFRQNLHEFEPAFAVLCGVQAIVDKKNSGSVSRDDRRRLIVDQFGFLAGVAKIELKGKRRSNIVRPCPSNEKLLDELQHCGETSKLV